MNRKQTNIGEYPPSIIHLGLKFANGVIVGSTARCLAFLAAVKKVRKHE